ncbi:MAG TPA: hypothetical protein VFF87_03515 [Hyphomicrobium sp.]|nr:hypothetical protein [Hyphomicrobium sp.]
MTATADDTISRANVPARASAALLLWCAIAVALFAAAFFHLQPGRLSSTLGDTDDATRLVEVQAFRDGASWYDMTLPRFGGTEPLQSHWSRLIDLPLAAMLSAFEQVTTPEQAERTVRTIWPLSLLLVLLYLLGREAMIRGGRNAGLLTVALAVTCITVIVQFVPGRIDHHNAMILCATIGLLRLSRSLHDPQAGWSAGALLGLGLAIGFEPLAVTVAGIGITVLFALRTQRSMLGPSRAAIAFAATLAIALLLAKAPADFPIQHCDALSLNIVLLAAISAVGVCLVWIYSARLSLAGKLAILAAAGATGIAAYGWMEPACLAGPFGQVEPELFPVWLDRVLETRNIFAAARASDVLIFAAAIYLGLGLYSGSKLVCAAASGDSGDVGADASAAQRDTRQLDLAMLAVATLLSCWQVKLLPYASCLAIPMIAVWLVRRGPAPDETEKPTGRHVTAAIAAGVVAMVGAAAWFAFSGELTKSTAAEAEQPVVDCSSNTAMAPLQQLAPGLAVADVNLGPYLVARTRLDVLSAPYHRLGRQILAAHEIFSAPAQEAQALLRAVGAHYVITCPELDSTRPAGGRPAGSLQALLQAGTPPPFLTPVALDGSTPLRVWRIAR